MDQIPRSGAHPQATPTSNTHERRGSRRGPAGKLSDVVTGEKVEYHWGTTPPYLRAARLGRMNRETNTPCSDRFVKTVHTAPRNIFEE